ncbi:MAG: T9SS type A sorting domain-containing protein [Bacteroidota bacterium]
MKKIFTILAFLPFLLLPTSKVSAQELVDIVNTGLSTPLGIEICGDQLYIADDDGGVLRANLTNALPTTPTQVYSGQATDIIKVGDDFFVGGVDAIRKFGASDTPPVSPTTIISRSRTYAPLLRVGDSIYVASWNNDRIFKFNINDNDPQLEAKASARVPFGLAIKGNDLYVSEFSSNRIVKFDITESNPTPSVVVSGVRNPAGLTFNGNFLYIAQSGKLVRIDINQENPTIEDVVTGLRRPWLSKFDGIDIYIPDGDAGKVVRFTVGAPTLARIPPVCGANASAQRGGASPTGGVYSGTGVTDNGDGETFTFDPATAGGVGTYEITYTLGEQSTTTMLEVVTPPNVDFTTLEDVRIDAGVQTTLSGGTPIGGVYSGTGVTDDGNGTTFTFDPSIAGVGVVEVTYSFNDDNGCDGMATTTLNVLPMGAQTEVVDVISGLSFPYGVEIEGDIMYISDDATGIIYQVDLTAATPTATPILTELIQPRGMEVVGNELYFTTGFQIRKVDLTQTPLSPTIVIEDLNDGANDLVFYNDSLYASLEESDQIIRFDISQANPAIDTLADSGLSAPTGIDIEDDVLYVAEFLSGQISTVSLNQSDARVEDFLFGAFDPVGVIVEGTYLYLTTLNNIQRFNLDQSSSSAEVLVRNLNAPRLADFYKGDLYFAESGTGKVRKLTSINVVFDDLGSVCLSDTAVVLGGATPQGGVYSGTGVTDDGNGETFTFDPSITGTGEQTITYTGANGTTATATLMVNDVVASISEVSNVSCAGDMDGSATVQVDMGTGSYTYSWSNGASTATASGLGAGMYQVTISDTGGCSDTLEVMITAPDSLMLSLTATPTTSETNPDGSIQTTVSGGTPPYNYSWNNASEEANLNGLAAGTYVLTVTDANDCSITASVEVILEEPDQLTGDICVDAIAIDSLFGGAFEEAQTSSIYDNTNYTNLGDSDIIAVPDCFFDESLERTIWYTFIGDGERYTIRTTSCSATDPIVDNDASMALYTGACDSLTEIACNDDENFDAELYNAALTIGTEVGTVYTLVIDGVRSSLSEGDGEFCLEVTKLMPSSVTDIRTTDIAVYPNPTNGLLQIDNILADEVEVFDHIGRRVKTFSIPDQTYDISDLPNGLYLLTIKKDDAVYTAKVVKQ